MHLLSFTGSSASWSLRNFCHVASEGLTAAQARSVLPSSPLPTPSGKVFVIGLQVLSVTRLATSVDLTFVFREISPLPIASTTKRSQLLVSPLRLIQLNESKSLSQQQV